MWKRNTGFLIAQDKSITDGFKYRWRLPFAMPKCGYADCEKYNHGAKGYFNHNHVVGWVAVDTVAFGRTFYCCKEHSEMK